MRLRCWRGARLHYLRPSTHQVLSICQILIILNQGGEETSSEWSPRTLKKKQAFSMPLVQLGSESIETRQSWLGRPPKHSQQGYTSSLAPGTKPMDRLGTDKRGLLDSLWHHLEDPTSTHSSQNKQTKTSMAVVLCAPMNKGMYIFFKVSIICVLRAEGNK